MSANFTPSLNVYTDLTPFRFWCQKVLPLAYDDSLSYYELLCKVVDYLNKTMEDVSLSIEDVEKLHAAYVSLQGYVNNYFNNLDVQEEINNKLDALVADGTIHEIFTPDVTAILNVARQASLDAIAAIPGEVTDWLDDNISQETGYVIDNTLTVSGAAADAKVTGGRLDALKSEIVNTSDELNITDYMFEFGTVSGVLNSNGEISTSSLHVTIADYVPVTLNKRYQIINSAGNTFTFYLCRYDSNKNLVGSLSVVDATNGVYNFSVNTEGVEYVRISVSKSLADKVTFKPRDARLTAIENDISVNTTDIAEGNNEIDNINKLLDTYNFIKTTSFSVGLLTNNGSVNASQTAWNTTGFISVESDTQYRIAKDLYPSSSFTLFVCLYNANEEFISYHSLNGPTNIKTTSETKYVKICVSASVAQQDVWIKLFPDRLTRIESDITGINDVLIKDVIPVNATHAYTGEYLDMSAKNLFNIVRFMESASMAVPSGTTGQAFDIYKNYLVQFFADDKCRIYDITTGEILATIDVTSGHGNSACFSKAFYSNNDVLPLMYVSDTNGNVYLTRITMTEATTITHLYFDSVVFGYASQVAEDDSGNYVYACANALGGNYITAAKITKCDMTQLTDNGDGSYTPLVVESFTVTLESLPGNNNVLQGVKYHNGKIYMTSGGNSANIKSVINVIDLETETIAAFFGDFPDAISVPELEDVSLWLNPATMKYEMVLYLRETAYYKLVL